MPTKSVEDGKIVIRTDDEVVSEEKQTRVVARLDGNIVQAQTKVTKLTAKLAAAQAELAQLQTDRTTEQGFLDELG